MKCTLVVLERNVTSVCLVSENACSHTHVAPSIMLTYLILRTEMLVKKHKCSYNNLAEALLQQFELQCSSMISNVHFYGASLTSTDKISEGCHGYESYLISFQNSH